MGDTPRPVDGRPDQYEQAQLIRRTGNGPTVDGEEELLRERFGTPDMAGVYRGTDAPAADTTTENEDQADDAAAAPAEASGTTENGGTKA